MKKELKIKKEEAEIKEDDASKKEDEVQIKEGKVGAMLHEARLKKGKKINEAAKDLCIRQAYLAAIEASNYDEIPEAPYGTGFIRSYAAYLGLNSARLVQLYKEETAAEAQSSGEYYVIEPQTEVTAPNKKYILISLLAVFLVYFAWILYNENRSGEIPAVEENFAAESNGAAEYPLQVEDFASVEEPRPAETTPLATVEPVEEQKTEAPEVIKVNEGSYIAPAASENTTEVPAAESQDEGQAKPQTRVQIKVKGGDTWIEVKDAQKLYLSKVLHDGDVYNVPDGGGMILSVGRYDGVDVLIDGKLTEVVKPNKKSNIALDKFLEPANH